MTWTHFSDMYSGGSRKTAYDEIFIQGSGSTARGIFQDRFNRDPDNVTCNCCGGDYAINDDYATLEEATEYYRRGISLEEYLGKPNVLVIRAENGCGGACACEC